MSLAHRFLSGIKEGDFSGSKARKLMIGMLFLVVGVVLGYLLQRALFSVNSPVVATTSVKSRVAVSNVTNSRKEFKESVNTTREAKRDNLGSLNISSSVLGKHVVVANSTSSKSGFEKKEKKSSRSTVNPNAKTSLVLQKEASRKMRLVELLEKATDAFNEGNYAEALRFYREALKLSPGNRKALLNLGVIYYQLGQDKRAVYYFRRLLRRYPWDTDALNNLAVIYMKRGDYRRALELLDRCLKKDPVNRVALINKGICLERLNRHQEALEVFRRGMRLYPDEYRFYLYAGVLLYEKGDTASAYPLLKRAYLLVEDKGGEIADMLRRVLER